MRLNAVVFGLGNHEAAWRMPESNPLDSTSPEHWIGIGRLAEEAGFDALFLGDVLALLQGAERHLSDAMDPLVVLSVLAATTKHIGLIGTASTSFEAPYHLARRFASLDHMTHGRAGWNVVTSSNVREARNFGYEQLPDHAERYARAADTLDAALALWESWDPDARIANKATGFYLDPARLHQVDHAGPYVRTTGPLNTPRSPQGRPVLVQAGSSADGRALAATYADVVFTAQTSLTSARDFYGDIKRRAVAAGRDPEQVLVMPGLMPVVAASRWEAEDRLAAIDQHIVHDHALALLSEYLQLDADALDLDEPLPAMVQPRSETNQSRLDLILDLSRREHLSVRQLLARVGGGRGHLLQAGTPEEIVDTMQSWFEARGADGFNIMPPVLPADLETFSNLVMPELKRRGLRQEAAEGQTLRQRYGLKVATRLS